MRLSIQVAALSLALGHIRCEKTMCVSCVIGTPMVQHLVLLVCYYAGTPTEDRGITFAKPPGAYSETVQERVHHGRPPQMDMFWPCLPDGALCCLPRPSWPS